MTFTAKMTLLSETTQERMLYSLFSADESNHLRRVLSHLPETPVDSQGQPFVQMLEHIIREGERDALVLLIQVVLEGWGIIHYHGLARSCRDARVRDTLIMILKDEARHHGSGMILARLAPLGAHQSDFVRETMIGFLAMLQCGPQSLVSVLEKELGPLSRRDRERVFTELDGPGTASVRLELIRTLLLQGGADGLVATLDRAGSFRPWTIDHCVARSAGER